MRGPRPTTTLNFSRLEARLEEESQEEHNDKKKDEGMPGAEAEEDMADPVELPLLLRLLRDQWSSSTFSGPSFSGPAFSGPSFSGPPDQSCGPLSPDQWLASGSGTSERISNAKKRAAEEEDSVEQVKKAKTDEEAEEENVEVEEDDDLDEEGEEEEGEGDGEEDEDDGEEDEEDSDEYNSHENVRIGKLNRRKTRPA